MPLSKTDFKISTDILGKCEGISVTDVSPWTGTDRELFGFLLLWYEQTLLNYQVDVEHPLFENWTVESPGVGTYKVTLYGLPVWNSGYSYITGDMVLSFTGNATRDTSTGTDEGEWVIFAALQNNSNSRPIDNPTDWQKVNLTNYTATQIKALLDSLTDHGDYLFHEHSTTEILDCSGISISKNDCNDYTVSKSNDSVDGIKLYTMEQWNENLDPINDTIITFDGNNEASVVLTDYTDGDGNQYKDGVYVLEFFLGTDKVNMTPLVFIEVCQIRSCYNTITIDILCSDCGCDDPCDDDDNLTLRRKRDLLNTMLSAYGHLLSLLHEEYSEAIGVIDMNATRRERLTEASFAITKLLDYINTCNYCD